MSKIQADAALSRAVISSREAAPNQTDMKVGNVAYDKSAEGNKALGSALESLELAAGWRPLGTWYGWNVEGLKSDSGGYKISLTSPETGLSYTSTTLNDPGVVGNRLRTVLNKVIEEDANLPSRLEENRNMLERYQTMREGWPQEDQLKRLERQYQCLRYEVYNEGSCPPDDGDAAFITADINRDIGGETYDALKNGLDGPTDAPTAETTTGETRAEPLAADVVARDPVVPPPAAIRTDVTDDELPPVAEPLAAASADTEPPDIRVWVGRALTQGGIPVVLTQTAAEPGDEAQFNLSGQDLYQDLEDVYTSVVPLDAVNPTRRPPSHGAGRRGGAAGQGAGAGGTRRDSSRFAGQVSHRREGQLRARSRWAER